MPNFITNRGKVRLMRGDWDDLAAGDILVGLLSGASVPTSIDTQAEANPLNTVADLLALAGVTEATGAWYSRQALTRTAAAEDDTNNRVNMDASDVVWANATAGVNIWGAFVFVTGASDAARDLISVITFGSVVATNGANLTLAIADLFRAS